MHTLHPQITVRTLLEISRRITSRGARQRQVYTPNDRFPKGGKMSQLLDSLDIGDTIDIKGPVGEIVYLEPGQFLIKGQPRNATKLAMLAGGTGITPMYQVIKAVLSDPADKTECSLVYANQTEEDILLKQEVGRSSGRLCSKECGS